MLALSVIGFVVPVDIVSLPPEPSFEPFESSEPQPARTAPERAPRATTRAVMDVWRWMLMEGSSLWARKRGTHRTRPRHARRLGSAHAANAARRPRELETRDSGVSCDGERSGASVVGGAASLGDGGF